MQIDTRENDLYLVIFRIVLITLLCRE